MRRRRERTVPMEGIDGLRSGGADEEVAIMRPGTLPTGAKFLPRHWNGKEVRRSGWRRRWPRWGSKASRSVRGLRGYGAPEQLQETAEALGITAASVKTRAAAGAADVLRDLLAAAGWGAGLVQPVCHLRRGSKLHGGSEPENVELRTGVARDFELP